MAPRVAHGIELFNQREFFECHEVLEAEWTEEASQRRWFLQSLIHLAVGFYHHQQGNLTGLDRQITKGLKKLAGFLPVCEGIDTRALYEETLRWRDGAGAQTKDYPRIRSWDASNF
jgi:predicted metal-dependent hydrolase